VNSNFEEKLELSSRQASWIEKRVKLFNEKKQKAFTKKDIMELEKEGKELIRLIENELKELERLEKDA